MTRQDGDLIYFNGGVYNQASGEATMTQSSYPTLLDKMVALHLQTKSVVVKVLATVYGVLLLFLAVSFFWMYRPGAKPRRRGIYLSLGGAVLTIIVMMI